MFGEHHNKTRNTRLLTTLGRFLQTDPIGYEDQYNLYAYVGNDPVNLVDPSGEAGILVLTCTPGPQAVVCAGAAVVTAIVVDQWRRGQKSEAKKINKRKIEERR